MPYKAEPQRKRLQPGAALVFPTYEGDPQHARLIDLPLSVRTINLLLRHCGPHAQVATLIAKSERDLLGQTGFGKGSVAEIRAWLRQHGLGLRGELPELALEGDGTYPRWHSITAGDFPEPGLVVLGATYYLGAVNAKTHTLTWSLCRLSWYTLQERDVNGDMVPGLHQLWQRGASEEPAEAPSWWRLLPEGPPLPEQVEPTPAVRKAKKKLLTEKLLAKASPPNDLE